MKFNLKVIVVGGLAMYVTHWIISMGTGPLIHEGILTEMYEANEPFWRPELNQQPPDMAAGWSGIFNLPEMIWVWWSFEALVAYAIGGAVLGLVVGKLSPE